MADTPTVIDIIETADGVEGTLDIQTGDTRTRSFRVFFEGFNQSVDAARNATCETSIVTAIPGYGENHPENSFIYVLKKSGKVTSDSNGSAWDVTVEYGVLTANANPSPSPSPAGADGATGDSPPPDPETPQKFSINYWTKTSAPQADILGNAFLNAAYDFYETPPTREDEYLMFTAVRTSSKMDYDWLDSLNNCINVAAHKIGNKTYAAGTLKANITAEWPGGSDGKSWTVTIVVRHDPDGWDWQIINAGFNKLVLGGIAGIKKVPIILNGYKPSKPQLLDASGFLLAPNGNPTYKTYRKHYKADFAYLGLGYPA
ncbi:hypothetical protein [Zavarzinella formosa]|uniref:hypothetical protein n=1 Tax=Zavarzinella formosa TaxID=360055 RepID=UPI00031370B7|nr:hypothetical protein [Zavarzinella formosa]